jgi:tetratricopeptide (TPR) repeat protein
MAFNRVVNYLALTGLLLASGCLPLVAMATPHIPAPVVASLNVGQATLQLRLQLAYELLSNGELLSALPLLEASISQQAGQTNSELASLLGYTHAQLGHTQEAKAYYLKALTLPQPSFVTIYGGLARLAFKELRYDEAISYQQKLLSYAPLNAQHYHDLSVLYASDSRYAEAAQASQQALNHGMRTAVVYNNLGYALAKAGLPAQGLEAINQALALDPTDPATQDSKGFAYFQLKQYPEALMWYDKALATDPTLAETYWHRAQVLQAMAQHTKALHDIEVFLQLSPTAPEAVEAKALAQLLRQLAGTAISSSQPLASPKQ